MIVYFTTCDKTEEKLFEYLSIGWVRKAKMTRKKKNQCGCSKKVNFPQKVLA